MSSFLRYISSNRYKKLEDAAHYAGKMGCFLFVVSMLFLVAMRAPANTIVVYSSNCPPFCVVDTCTIIVSGVGNRISGPCSCAQNNSRGPTSYYCADFETIDNFNDSHPLWTRWKTAFYCLVGFTVLCFIFSLSICEWKLHVPCLRWAQQSGWYEMITEEEDNSNVEMGVTAG